MRKFSLVIACALCLWQGSTVQAAQSDVERQTRFGTVVGIDDSGTTGTYAWKGVPFAKPPVGELRWKAPVDPDEWKSPRETQQFGNACVQYGRIYGPGANNRYDATIGTTLNQAVGSEDCLYLNIWRPADRRGGLPVIVFVHGGSNVSGYTADPVYDGAALAKTANAVVVTVNYRLGIFGFLNLAQLKTGADAQEDSGNFALLDIIKALQFVRHDIANFGGNPTNVTLMGQSAGAINVYALLTTPATVDARPRLFHRAVPLSGGISLASNLPPGTAPDAEPGVGLRGPGQPAALRAGDRRRPRGRLGRRRRLGRQPDARADRGLPAGQDAGDPAVHAADQARRARPGRVRARSPTARCCQSTRSARSPPATTCGCRCWPATRATRASCSRPSSRLFGGPSGRLVTDKQLFDIQFAYQPDAPPQITIEQWIPAVYLPVTTPVTGFNAKTELLDQIFLGAAANNVLEHAEVAAERRLVLPLRLGRGAGAVQRHLRRGARVRPAVRVRQLRAVAVLEHRQLDRQPSRVAWRCRDAMMASLGAFARSGDPNAPRGARAQPGRRGRRS